MQAQDSSHPTGVTSDSAGRTTVSRARLRKSNAAIQMRLAGASWAEISLALGYPTPRAALVAVEKALERELHSQGDRDNMRRLAGARLERLLRGVWPKATDPEHPEHLYAMTKAREIIAEHAKLYGLNAPTEIVVHNPTQAELEKWVSLVLTGSTPHTVIEADIIDAETVEEPRALPAG